MAGGKAHPLTASIAAAARFANIRSLNDGAFELLTDLTLFNLKLAINSIDHRMLTTPHVGQHARLFAALSVRRRTLTKIGIKISGILLMAASLASAMTSGATAADLASIYYGGPARSFAFTWAGPYAGATVGYEWGTIDNNPAHPNGVAGGLEAGFNWQNGNIVYGGEADINLSAADNTFAPWQFPIPGSARCEAAPESPSIICCCSGPPVLLTAR
jgi:hypothetical protein